MNGQNLKYLVFIFLVFAVLSLSIVAISNFGTLTANALWIFAALLFVFVVWKGDIILLLEEYQRAVIMRFGRVARVGGPGWCLVVPFIEKPTIVDLRTQTVDVPKQDVITKGNIELKIDSIIYLRVKKDKDSVIKSVIEVENYKNAISLYVISSIRDIIGSMVLEQVLTQTEYIETELQKAVEKISASWGVEIVSVDLKDVDVPKTVLDAMHLEKAAGHERLARIERAKAHEYEIETVKRAAEMLSDKALSYLYVRALEKLGEGRSTKFFFPAELTSLAQSIGRGAKSESELEGLFKKYAPAVTSVLSREEKKKLKRNARKKK